MYLEEPGVKMNWKLFTLPLRNSKSLGQNTIQVSTDAAIACELHVISSAN